MSEATRTTTPPPSTAPARSKGHVYEADVVRVLTFACVIAVHVISHTEPTSSVPANGLEMLLHFTREAFFALTGFVLLHQSLARARPLPVPTFWRRRLVAVVVPYVAWSVIYTGIQATAGFRSWGYEAGHLASNLAYGTAWYHLYFLLVTMQIYLLFPLIEALVRATARHHAVLLAISAAAQLALLTVQQYDLPTHGWLAQVAGHQDALIISYQFYVLAGAVAAYHLDQLREFVHRHPRGLLTAIFAAAAGAEIWYLLAVNDAASPVRASAVLQPATLVWSMAAVIGLFMLGSAYADRRVAGDRTDRWLARASDRSFGVFLVHPLILWLLLEAQVRVAPGVNPTLLTVVAYVVVVAGSLAATEVFRRTPLSLLLTGRRVLRPVKKSGIDAPDEVTAAHGKEINHAHNHADSPGTRHEASPAGNHDGDRHRAADSLLL
jgi:peptidoglycan/LPS O-acetylase OafA/YrhL